MTARTGHGGTHGGEIAYNISSVKPNRPVIVEFPQMEDTAPIVALPSACAKAPRQSRPPRSQPTKYRPSPPRDLRTPSDRVSKKGTMRTLPRSGIAPGRRPSGASGRNAIAGDLPRRRQRRGDRRSSNNCRRSLPPGPFLRAPTARSHPSPGQRPGFPGTHSTRAEGPIPGARAKNGRAVRNERHMQQHAPGSAP